MENVVSECVRNVNQRHFFRLDNGKGQALCNRCSLNEAQENIDFESKWLKKQLIRLILCTVFIVFGLIGLLAGIYSGDAGTCVLAIITCWGIAGVIASIGGKTKPGTVKDQIKEAVSEYSHPFLHMIIKFFSHF